MRQRIEDLSNANQAVWIQAEKPGGWQPSILVRASNAHLILQQCGWRAPDGSVHFAWKSLGEHSNISFASCPRPGDVSKPLGLVFVPRVAELSFEIASLPGAPNPATPKTLFDVVLPRVTLAGEVAASERHILGYIGASAQVAWQTRNRWDDHPPKSFPDDRTFRGMTSLELLHWYLRAPPRERRFATMRPSKCSPSTRKPNRGPIASKNGGTTPGRAGRIDGFHNRRRPSSVIGLGISASI